MIAFFLLSSPVVVAGSNTEEPSGETNCLHSFYKVEGAAECSEVIRVGFVAHSEFDRQVLPILRQAYRKVGVEVAFVGYPAERQLQAVSKGQVDGDALRVALIENKYKNLVRVNIPLLTLRGYAYTNREDIEEYSTKVLDEYSLIHERGILWSENVLEGRQASEAASSPELFKMLDEKRADIALGTEISAEEALRSIKEPKSVIRKLYPPITVMRTYHYLHDSHRHLAPKLEAALKEIIGE
ncbi:hypothetical protein [Kiloniella sp. b19]|uniref:hypothetical protein n=1 Tax=Kiloniella sp. GXU_MW_B19 TaxID=3141326 RepID=UPI0031E154DB